MFKKQKIFSVFPYSFSKNSLVYYFKCCHLVGYAIRYLFVIDIEQRRVTRQDQVFRGKTMLIFPPRFLKQFWRNNEHKFVFTKTIRLFALTFYEAIVNSSFALVNYHLRNVELVNYGNMEIAFFIKVQILHTCTMVYAMAY